MNTTPFENRAAWWGRGLFLAALLLYLATLSPGFFPGISAALVAGHLGLHAFPATMHHVWGWIIAAIAAVPIGPLAVRLHVFGAVCSAVSVWLLFQITVRLRRQRAFEQGMPHADAERVRLFSAIFAAVALAISIPFWITATRAHPISLSLMLMLAAFFLLLRYGEDGRFSRLVLAVALYAVGMADYASLLLYAPIFGLMLLIYQYQHGHLQWGNLFKLLGVALLGAAPVLLAAALYTQSDAYAWREFKHYGMVVWYMLLDQYRFVLRALPRVGWLTVGVVSFLPWVAVYGMGISRRSLSMGTWFGSALLCALLSALGVVLLLDVMISPWALTQDQPLLITPYVLIAMWTASVAGYWLALAQRIPGAAGVVISRAWMIIAIGFLAVVGARNVREASGRDGRVFARYASEVVDRVDKQAILLSASPFDDLVLLEARARGNKLKSINLRQSQSLAYRRYIAGLFDDPRLKSLAEINVQPLMVEWFARETNIAERVAVLDLADLWMAAGRIPEPRGPMYVGHVPGTPVNIEELAGDNRKYWTTFAAPASALHWAPRHPAAAAVRLLLAQSAKSANNLGVLWEEIGQPALAEEAYRKARQFDTNNISSLVNLHALLQRQGNPEAAELERTIEGLITREAVRRQLWSLSYHQGAIRSPELYASRGWAWAMSGKPALAAENLRQAIDLGGESSALRLALSALDAAQEGAESAEEVLQAELERDPKNLEAAVGLYRLAIRRGQFSIARGRLEALRELKVGEEFLRTEEALLEVLSGNTERAATLLADIVRRTPDNIRAWAALAVVAGERNDAKTVREALDRLQQARRATPAVRYMAAQVALREGDRVGARRQLEQILRQEPRHAPAMELMIRLAMMEGDRAGAEAMVERLVANDPRHPFANYMLGAMQAIRGQYLLAESSYRVALESRRTPEALNDLAYVLTRLNRHAEALPLIEECMRISELNGAAWSTYGIILLAMDRYAEAENALQKALISHPESVEVQYNLARVFEKTGRRQDALKLAESISARSGELLRDDQDGLRDLLRRLRSGG